MNRIKEVLEEKGIKQTWLAEQLGKSVDSGSCSPPIPFYIDPSFRDDDPPINFKI